MSLNSYGDLKTAVQSWATRTDSPFATKVPDFIRLGEERIWQTVRTSDMISLPVTLTVPAGQNWVNLPDDWLAFRSLATSNGWRVEYLAPDVLHDLPTPGDAAAYSIEGRRFLYGQTPSVSAALTMRYYQHPGLLSDSLSTNWLLTKAPSVYLYAALLEGYIWAKNPQKVGEYGKLYDDAVARLMSSDRAAMISGGPLRMVRR